MCLFTYIDLVVNFNVIAYKLNGRVPEEFFFGAFRSKTNAMVRTSVNSTKYYLF
jgi:hypothetical protein